LSDDDHISQDDLVLHAMDALSYEEAEGVRRHLTTCAPCRDDLAKVHGDLALVAMSVDQHPVPEGAKQRFIQRIAAEGKAASTTPALAQTPTRVPAAPAPAKTEVVPIDHVPPKRRASWVPWLAAAALLALAAWLGMRVNQLGAQLASEQDATGRLAQMNAELAAKSAHAERVLEVLTARDAQHAVLTAATKPVPMGRAVYLAQNGGLVFQGGNLAPLPQDKTYELWVIPANGTAPIAAGMFRPDAAGNASVMMPSLPKGVPAKAFGITIENAGGSATPTMPIVLSGAASSAGE
jgi:Anti-sigma-K factor rskA/Putative zinc-finger